MTPRELLDDLGVHIDGCNYCRVADLCPKGLELRATYEAAAWERDKGAAKRVYSGKGKKS